MTRDPRTARFAPGVEVVYGDFERPETWLDVLEGIQRVYLSPFAYVAPKSETSFVDQAVQAGVQRFMVHSAAAAGFESVDDPGDRTLSPLRRHLAEERQTHRELELMVETTDVEWTHVRPGLLAANALGWAPRIRAERVVREPYGEPDTPWFTRPTLPRWQSRRCSPTLTSGLLTPSPVRRRSRRPSR